MCVCLGFTTDLRQCVVGLKHQHIVNGDHLEFVVWKIYQTTPCFFLLLFVNGAAIPLKLSKFHMNLKNAHG